MDSRDPFDDRKSADDAADRDLAEKVPSPGDKLGPEPARPEEFNLELSLAR